MNEDKNFMDSRTLLAIALVAAVWFGWQTYLAKKYPQMTTPAAVTQTESGQKVDANSVSQNPQVASKMEPAILGVIKNVSETLKDVKTDEASFQISSEGLAVKNLKLNKYSQRDKSPFEFAQGQSLGLFSMGILEVSTGTFQPLHFEVQETPKGWEGVAQLGSSRIVRKVIYESKDYSLANEIQIENPSADLTSGRLALAVALSETKEAKRETGFLMGNYDHQEFYVNHSAGKSDRINATSAKEKIDKSFPGATVMSIASQYFASALVDKSEVIPTAKIVTDLGPQPLVSYFVYNLANTSPGAKISFKSFAGPKAHDLLSRVDAELPEILDFGYFSAIGKVLLSVLRAFNKVFNNWGLSIVFLTLVVRMLVLPVNITSYRSMKRMQRIQPLMASLRERYKDDPTQLQKETMALMKREKVNPVGGCLPMLLQMPIFFALFSVLGHSIELYQAPFFGWISDLSLKDPYFVLPVLVGIIFFVQQKITPTTMDPTQAKVMQFMPIFFAFMMVSLPSGLNLYTFISTLFGVTQQRIFMRDRHKETNPQPVKA